MNDAIKISNLNDFVFCPVSIYFHNLYGDRSTMTYYNSSQLNGTKAHESIDKGNYSTKQSIITSIDVYCEKYNLIGKIDIYDGDKKMLIERKRHINTIYDGYVFQLYAQYFAMIEMGYRVDYLYFYSMDDNKKYSINLPYDDKYMFDKFEKTISEIKNFSLEDFKQENIEKCKKCVYEPACDRGLL